MAIKERKQITGTAAQIKGFAGHKGVLAYATDTKHLHVLSGTAGTTTELANRTDIPDITGKANTTYVNAELAKKQNKGDYATTSALTSGLAGKANSSHTHTSANVTDLQATLDATITQASKKLIPKTGNRGAIAGYELSTEGTTVTHASPDTQHTSKGNITVANGAANSWTKVISMTGGRVSLSGNAWAWAGGEAPELRFPGILVCHWNGQITRGIASFISGAS